MTKFGYPTVAKSMDITPDQAATITADERSIDIKAGTFDAPVTFDLLTSDPSTWSDKVQGRTVHDAFAFRVTDKATKALVATFKQPVVYTYTDTDVQSTDVILNTTAASPPVITQNATPITFAAGKVSHSFGGAGVGWLLASAPTSGAATTPAAVAQASPAASATAPAATTASAATTAPSATTAPAATTAPSATAAATATRPAATTAPVATGTGGGTAATSAPTTLPKTGEARATNASAVGIAILGAGMVLLVAGIALVMRRRTATRR
ncbi:MAG: LPXTG cell wall anchor domain-containing protein [Thermomicrobiales bacterium]